MRFIKDSTNLSWLNDFVELMGWGCWDLEKFIVQVNVILKLLNYFLRT